MMPAVDESVWGTNMSLWYSRVDLAVDVSVQQPMVLFGVQSPRWMSGATGPCFTSEWLISRSWASQVSKATFIAPPFSSLKRKENTAPWSCCEWSCWRRGRRRNTAAHSPTSAQRHTILLFCHSAHRGPLRPVWMFCLRWTSKSLLASMGTAPTKLCSLWPSSRRLVLVNWGLLV